MSPRDARLALSSLALLALLGGCRESPIEPPPEPSPLKPLGAARPPPARPAVTLPPRVADALQGIEWEPLDYLEYLPELAYKVQPDCTLRYVDLGVLSLSDSALGTVKQSFYEVFELEPGGPGRMVRRPGRRLEYSHILVSGRRKGGFLDTSRQRRLPIPLVVEPQKIGFPSVLSPIFQLRTAKTVGQPSPVDVWPALPTRGEATPWRYNLLFDKPEDLATRPAAKVELLGWIRLGFQRAAYLTATWPEGADSVPIGPDLAHVRVQGRRPLTSTVRQRGELKGHYLVSENGYLVLAHLEGTAQLRNVFSVRKRRGAKAGQAEYEVNEDRNFSFTTKLLEDCNGSLFSKVESEELAEAEIVELLARFSSLMAIDRNHEAAELLSPAIRYAFPEGAPLLLIKETFRSLGTSFLGEPLPEKPDADERGVTFVGRSKRTRRAFHSTVRGARIAGRPYLTFIGSSSRRDRKQWDLLVVEPGNIHSGVVKVSR